MKTAVSMPDDLFASAERLSRKLGMSRSRLIATALAEFVAKHKTSKVTEQLNAAYLIEPNELDPLVAEAARRTLLRSEW